MDKQGRLVQWLRDAHAMEMQAETMLSTQAERIEHYPELRRRIVDHIDETRDQAKKIASCLERHGGDTSTVKDMTAKSVAAMQGFGGMMAGDEIVKGAMASYTFEHFEISAYEALIAAAAAAGDAQTRQVCEQILEQEKAMASWLMDHLADVTNRYLELESQGMEAKV